ncbi:MAG: leucine-rich repeat domain-containing protein [Clostridia bacterium]|nr:leucine-rich repeat domain-containing protein [Clostridia bacterium]
MKRLLCLLICIICCFTFSACVTLGNGVGTGSGNGGTGGTGGNGGGGTGGSSPSNDPVYSETYSYDETHHWRRLISGEGDERIDYAEHENERGKCECGKYFDPTRQLDFEKVTLGDVKGYRIIGYKDEDFFGKSLYVHYQTPTHYQGDGDAEPLPVISIGYGAFGYGTINGQDYNPNECIQSIKLHEGLLEIKDYAFKNSEIEELIIPDSVTNQYHYSWQSTVNGRLYNICGGCYKLKKFVVGDGIKVLGAHNFGGSVEEVHLGSSLQTIQPRAFYEIYDVKSLVIPALVNYIPEGSVTPTSGNYAGISIPLITMLPATARTVIYMEITKAEHDALIVPLRQRDPVTGAILDPIDYGFVNGWSGNCKVYFKGEWSYDANGNPVANS